MKFACTTALLGLALASPAIAGDDIPTYPDTSMTAKTSHSGKHTETGNYHRRSDVYDCAEWCKNRQPITPPPAPQPPVYTHSQGTTGRPEGTAGGEQGTAGGEQGTAGGEQGAAGGEQGAAGGEQGAAGGEQDINSYNKPPVIIAAGDRVQPVFSLLALAVAAFL